MAVTLGVNTNAATTTPAQSVPPYLAVGTAVTTHCNVGYRANSSTVAPYTTYVVQTCTQMTSTTAAWTNDSCVCEFCV